MSWTAKSHVSGQFGDHTFFDFDKNVLTFAHRSRSCILVYLYFQKLKYASVLYIKKEKDKIGPRS